MRLRFGAAQNRKMLERDASRRPCAAAAEWYHPAVSGKILWQLGSPLLRPLGATIFRNLAFALMFVFFAGTPLAVHAADTPADTMGLHQVEITFHQAASTKDINLMMSLFAEMRR